MVHPAQGHRTSLVVKVHAAGDMDEPWSFTVGAKRSKKRARFNLLALEHGEYYFQVMMSMQ